MFDERLQTDARFERAVIEALHAGQDYVREEAEPRLVEDPIASRVAEAAKWRVVARAARGW